MADQGLPQLLMVTEPPHQAPLTSAAGAGWPTCKCCTARTQRSLTATSLCLHQWRCAPLCLTCSPVHRARPPPPALLTCYI